MNDDILPLIRGCLSGDRASWDILIREYSSIAVQILRSRYSSLSASDHEDIIQIISIKLLNNGLRNFNGATKYELLGYFRTITIRETVSYLRQTARHRSNTSLDQPVDGDDSDCSLLDIMPDERLHPNTIAEINDLYRKAMENLSLRDRQILIYKVEGYLDREIADMLGIPMNTVASSYSRIKELLRRTLVVALLIILYGRKFPWMPSL